jgi:hypothetical protein
MARFVSLKIRVGGGGLLAAGFGLLVSFGTSARAQAPMQPEPAMAPAAAATNAAPVPAPAPAKSVAPPPHQDTMGRYGKILAPGNEVAHPLILKMPFPGVGEIKVPKPDELDMRRKLEELAKLSDDDIRKQLLAWPAFSKMSLHDEGSMLQRIQDFRNYRTNIAMAKAREMGLLSTLTPEQKLKFEKDYWDKRLKLDQDLDKQFLPIYQAHEQKLEDELFREFSSAAPGPKPPAPANKPPPPAPVKPVVSSPQLTNTAPIAQAPH